MRRPGAPFNPIYQTHHGGGVNHSFDGNGGGYRTDTTAPPSITRRPQSALAGGASRRLVDISGDTVNQPPPLQTGNLKMTHLSLSRKIIELWDMLEIPAHRRQASIGSSMVLLYPTADNVTLLRALVDELEAYRVTREQSSKHIFSSLGGLPDASRVGGNVYRPHPLDELPLAQRRPVSASLMRTSPSPLFAKRQQPAWSRPTSALSTHSSIEDVSYIAATAATKQHNESDLVQSSVDLSRNAGEPVCSDLQAARVSTSSRPPSAKLRSLLPTNAKSASSDVVVFADSNRAEREERSIDPNQLSERIATTLQTATQPCSLAEDVAVVGVRGPELVGTTSSLVDASTMTIESYLVQDSAVVKELFYMEEIHRHDLEEQCRRPISKLNLLFLTRLADIEERLLRGITRTEKDLRASNSRDSELLDAITGRKEDANEPNEHEVYALAASRIKRLTMEEAVGRIGITESAERIAEIEFAFVVTQLEEEANRASLCGVLEDASWCRIIQHFTTSLETTLFQGLELITEAYLRRYDLEREEHFDRVGVQDAITRQLTVLRWASGLYVDEARRRKMLVQEEVIAQAVIETAVLGAQTAHLAQQLGVLSANETSARSDLTDAAACVMGTHYERASADLERVRFIEAEKRTRGGAQHPGQEERVTIADHLSESETSPSTEERAVPSEGSMLRLKAVEEEVQTIIEGAVRTSTPAKCSSINEPDSCSAAAAEEALNAGP